MKISTHPLPFAPLSLLIFSLCIYVFGCAASHEGHRHGHGHGEYSELSASSAPDDLCTHRVPQDVCVKHHPELAAKFKSVNDWCAPHEVPESQCHTCHKDLSFVALPDVRKGADLKPLTSREALEGIEKHTVQGKVTVVDFWASWCVPCRKVDAHLLAALNSKDNLAVRKVQVEDWDDPLAAKYLNASPTLPLVVVFNAKGEKVGQVSGGNIDALETLLKKAQL